MQERGVAVGSSIGILFNLYRESSTFRYTSVREMTCDLRTAQKT